MEKKTYAALRLAPEPTELQRRRPGGRGNRTPAELRATEGTRPRAGNNAGVVEARPHDLPPIGGPPSRWPAHLKAAWRGLAGEVPWLRKSDRKMAILYCRLHVAFEEEYAAYEEADGAEAKARHKRAWLETGKDLFRLQQKLGMSPSDRTRVAARW